jgi:drug/metabolite transporter (DMT)-like permease
MFRRAAILEMITATALWGFGFVASVWALQALSPLWITAIRFTAAALVGTLILVCFRSGREKFKFDAVAEQFKLAFLPGVFLALTLILQTWGLVYTTATKSGFITILYVLIVPILEGFWRGRHLTIRHWFSVAIALVGVAMICNLFDTKGQLNWGDGLTLLAAVATGLQIFWFVVIQEKIGSSFHFNVYQSFWAGSIGLVCALATESLPKINSNMLSWPLPKSSLGMLSLIFGSTLIAFALQVRAQKKIAPSFASIVYLLESPFAAGFAILFLHERMSLIQASGGALILLSIGVAATDQK